MRRLPIIVVVLACAAGKKRRRRKIVAAPTNATNPLVDSLDDVSAHFHASFGHLAASVALGNETALLPRNALLLGAGDRGRLDRLSFDATTPLTLAAALRAALGDANFGARRAPIVADLAGAFAPPPGVQLADYFQLVVGPLLRGLLPRVAAFRLRVVGAGAPASEPLDAEGGWFRATFYAVAYAEFARRPAYRPPTLVLAEDAGLHDAVWDDDGGACVDHFGRRVDDVRALNGGAGVPRACRWREAFGLLAQSAVPVAVTCAHSGERALARRTLRGAGWVVRVDALNAFAPTHGGDDLDGAEDATLPRRRVDLLDADDAGDAYARAVWTQFRDVLEDPAMPAGPVVVVKNQFLLVAARADGGLGEL